MVSEFMLQQTTVAAVLPHYARWMAAFPDVRSLAAADEQKVLSLWQGLGYYSRARNLLRAARAIVSDFDGVVPREVSVLRKLPGVGPYTASAVAAFAFDQCVVVLDANVIRVVARLFDFRKPVGDAAGRLFLERSARSLLPGRGGWLHASSLMELGATICRSGKPDCPSCPVRKFCKARVPEEIPIKPPRKAMLREVDARAFALARGRVSLVQSEGPRWKGLWLLPPARDFGKPLLELPYIVTRHRISLEVHAARHRRGWTTFDPADLPPMPTPHRRALARLLEIMASQQKGKKF